MEIYKRYKSIFPHHSHLVNICSLAVGYRWPSQNSFFVYSIPLSPDFPPIFSLAGSSSVPLLRVSPPQESVLSPLFSPSHYCFKINLTNFHIVKHYHYTDWFEICVCSPGLSSKIQTKTSNHLFKLVLVVHFKLMAKTKFQI